MSGIGFQSKGTAGAASVTRWFGCLLPDLINMITPMHFDQVAGKRFYDAVTAANFGNQWTLSNLSWAGGANVVPVSFGGFVTAPDGTTNTAQQLVEDAVTNGVHSIVAGYDAIFNYQGAARFAAIMASAGRRAVMSGTVAFDNGGATGTQGVSCVFDLAGGQIGVAGAVFGSPPTTPSTWAALGQQMVSLGTFGGHNWYLCIVDIQYHQNGINYNPSQNFRFTITLDNGTGTNAQSTTYTGNGTSGVYIWKTNVLPIDAWAINNQTFLEDFNYTPGQVASAFDLGHTRAPGFKWYLNHSSWPGFPGLQPCNANAISVANSILTMTDTSGSSNNQIDSAVYNNDLIPSTKGYTGFVWQMPALIEHRMNYLYPISNTVPNALTTWTANTEAMLGTTFTTPQPPGREIGFLENVASTTPGDPNAHVFYYKTGGGSAGFSSTNSGSCIAPAPIAVWVSALTYGPANTARLSGVDYYSLDSPLNDPPPSGNWELYSIRIPITGVLATDWDPNQMMTLHTLCLPYNHQSKDYGYQMSFYNGTLAGITITYSPFWISNPDAGAPNGNVLSTVDNSHFPLFIGAGNNGTIGAKINVDWIKIYQP